jgi:hypothetical protein
VDTVPTVAQKFSVPSARDMGSCHHGKQVHNRQGVVMQLDGWKEV